MAMAVITVRKCMKWVRIDGEKKDGKNGQYPARPGHPPPYAFHRIHCYPIPRLCFDHREIGVPLGGRSSGKF